MTYRTINHFDIEILAFLNSYMFSFGLYAKETDWVSGDRLKPEEAVIDIRHYSLKLNVDPSTKTISGSAYIDQVLTEAAPVLLFDFVSFYKISEVTVNGKKIPYFL